MNFSDIMNIETNDFFMNYFEEKIIFSTTTMKLSKLEVPLEKWDAKILKDIILNGTITMVKDSMKVGNDFFINNGTVDLSRLYHLHLEGFTFYIKEVERFFPEVQKIVDRLERELHPYKLQTNLFISPGGKVGFNPHFDCHDVIVWQLKGAKRWKLWKAFCQDMTSETPSDDDSAKVQSLISTKPPLIDKTIRKDDVFYMPRGVIHAPEAIENSTHMTFWLKAPLLENINTKEELEFEKRKSELLYL